MYSSAVLKRLKMPSRHWKPCQILQQSQARLTLRSPRLRLRRRMSMRAREGHCFSIGKYQVFSPQPIGIVFLVSSAVTLATGKAFRIEDHAPGSLRRDITSACFHAKVWFTFQSPTVARSILYAGRTWHVKTLSQFMPRLTNAPRSLRPLLVSHCKRCPEYVVYDSLFQHSCVHTHRK